MAHTDVTVNINTLVTKATIETVGVGDFTTLAQFVDPQSWSTYSPFWRESYKVDLVGGQFVRDLNPPDVGTSWNGYLYEYVEWNWDAGIISAFQAYLNVNFNVDFTVIPNVIDLKLSLYNCRGSMLYTRVAEGGIDVDSGSYHAEPTTNVVLPGNAVNVDIKADKSLRFTPIVSRSTSHQGTVLSAELLNFMAPALVGLWFDELITDSTLLWEASI